ncbi:MULTISPECIES: serine/threonine-protein kinase [Prauserella salsuginis group]|uniref:non-specific serine/threonine protein kinase n=1 Tax=Prauserella salsuginis TaxID=387889 RepID=A0ABW6FX54_9PSEU|nr:MULTISPECIES: serine/threonine-protein kinase [Prauserella salsuginis group]MCR3720358.1 serine/threonine protein kinase [Prauserella flava]MCR3733933.1 serine/threonine protein kinase [Prauserella salsuginis]
MLSTGQLIAERYRLTSQIAVGGMGEVWEASDTRLDRPVAVKILKAELSGNAEFLHRFRAEAKTTASLNHQNIAAVHDYGETEAGESAIAFLVMEMVEGEPLAGILQREGRISAERTLDVLEQAGHALQAAHERGLVHRDVKPGNIMVTPTGAVKLTDFGIAKAADSAPVTRNGMVMGTAHYIAPEQALGQDAEPGSDVYSLAVCGYECLAGRRPFLSENAVTVAMMHIRDVPPPLPPDVPPAARAVIEATLVKDPRQRYASGGEFAAAVAAVKAGHPLPVPSGIAGYGTAGGQVTGAPAGQVTQAGQAGNQPQPNTVGQGSHPSMQPVSPVSPAQNGVMGGHGGTSHGMTPPGVGAPGAHQRQRPAGMWILLTLAAVLVVAVVAALLIVLLGQDSDPPPGRVGDQPPPTGSNWSQASGDIGGEAVIDATGVGTAGQPTTGPDGTVGALDENAEGMTGTPWTKWDGTEQ